MTAADHGPVDPARIDVAVVAALYEQYAEQLSLFLRGVLRNADLAAEALQNTFAKAVESGHTAKAESLKGWLFQVAFREALLIRRRSRMHERSLRQIVRNIQVSPKSSELPEERAFRSETLHEVRRALQELPPDQRQVIQMRIYEEKTFAVIAEELSLPLGTVLTRMRLALKRLSRQIRGTGNGKP